MSSTRKLAVIVALIAGASCFEPDLDSTLQVSFSAVPPLDSISSIHVEVSDGGSWSAVPSFSPFAPGVFTTDKFDIPGSGSLYVDAIILYRNQRIGAIGIRKPVQEDFGYGIGVYVGRGDPRSFAWVGCIPEVFSAPLEMKPPGITADSIYLTWHGLPKGAVC